MSLLMEEELSLSAFDVFFNGLLPAAYLVFFNLNVKRPLLDPITPDNDKGLVSTILFALPGHYKRLIILANKTFIKLRKTREHLIEIGKEIFGDKYELPTKFNKYISLFESSDKISSDDFKIDSELMDGKSFIFYAQFLVDIQNMLNEMEARLKTIGLIAPYLRKNEQTFIEQRLTQKLSGQNQDLFEQTREKKVTVCFDDDGKKVCRSVYVSEVTDWALKNFDNLEEDLSITTSRLFTVVAEVRDICSSKNI
ncbi:hypothetical protein C2G38_2136842 [Gigaspora rosea]|uniref:Uncharacterized protein n=1 Tax=Gigaspora rosea TaxID=44941 RepID=A0A397W5Z3_9GLOM|nr:hypothetical protein C2G38_2136842 [Gigaspora rosea]